MYRDGMDLLRFTTQPEEVGYRSQFEIAVKLLNYGADINAQTSEGITPLMEAVWST